MKSRFSQWAVSLTKLLWEAGRDKHPVTKVRSVMPSFFAAAYLRPGC